MNAGFVGGVDRLAELLAERQVPANKYVEVFSLCHRYGEYIT